MDEAEWPTQPIPEPVKDIIARFYALVDSSEPDCSSELANNVFTPDGEFVVNKRAMRGAERTPSSSPSPFSVPTHVYTRDNQMAHGRRLDHLPTAHCSQSLRIQRPRRRPSHDWHPHTGLRHWPDG